MKKIMFIIMILICAVSLNAQKYDYIPFISNDTTFENQCSNWEFTRVVKVDSSMSEEQLFMAALEFLNSKDFNITINDKEGGKIYGKGTFNTNREGSDGMYNKVYAIDGVVSFDVSVQCKKGRFKYTFFDYSHKDGITVNTFGQVNTRYSVKFNYGSFLNEEPNPGFGRTGRSKKCWFSIKNEFKRKTYYLIEDFKIYMSKKNIVKQESW